MVVLTIATSGVWAHDPGLSTGRVEVLDHALRFEVAFAPSDIIAVLPEAERTRPFTEMQPALERRVTSFYGLSRGGQRLPLPTGVTSLLNTGDNITFRFEVPRDAGTQLRIEVEGLAHLPGRHRHYMSVVTDGGLFVSEKLFQAGDVTLELQIPESSQSSGLATASSTVVAETTAAATPQEEFNRTRTFWAFFKLGVEHLVVGFDHLLFLFGLLLVCDRWRLMLVIITSFTVGHSITLALATLNVIQLEGKWVEAIIAASIVYVGVENLVRRGNPPPARWLVTLIFGLVHGMGFAGVLRGLGVGESAGGLVVPLVAFNLGVEAGQLALAAVGLPLLWRARKNDVFLRRGVPILSILVAAAGVYWLVERTLLGG